MDEQNQITIPPSFMDLYCRNGRPIETRPTIEARYDLCEDLAIQTSDTCRTVQFNDDLPEADVLRRCFDGLCVTDVVTREEARWVTTRVAELLMWPMPEV